MIIIFIGAIIVIIFILMNIAFLTLYERHFLGISQNRLGPNKRSLRGVLQAILDGIKLLSKEQIIPLKRILILFYIAPVLSFILIFREWLLIPLSYFIVNFQLSYLLFLSLVGFMVYTTIVAGFRRNSKYATVGRFRARAQRVSYEVVLNVALLCLIRRSKSLEFTPIFYNSLTSIPVFIVWLIIALAETNRAPFDFREGERELVRGFNVEYSSLNFVLFFLREYGAIIFFSQMRSVLFFNGHWEVTLLILTFIIWVRRVLPRFRFDFLLNLMWFKLLPLSLGLLFFWVLN